MHGGRWTGCKFSDCQDIPRQLLPSDDGNDDENDRDYLYQTDLHEEPLEYISDSSGSIYDDGLENDTEGEDIERNQESDNTSALEGTDKCTEDSTAFHNVWKANLGCNISTDRPDE